MLDRRAMLGAALAYPAQAWAVPKRTPGGRRIINAMMFEDPAHLNYPLSNTRIMQEICGNINESLLLFDWQFKPQPNLADSFEMSPDGLHYVFHLRRDVLWHDGVPFTAKDVAFSCGVMLPQLNPRSRASFSHIASIKTPDRYTVEFQLSQPFNAFLLSFMASSAPMMPAHIFEGTDFRTNPYNFKPIGTGPFKFADWKRGQHIHLTRNERYWRPGRPGMDEVYYRVCPTPEQRLVAMETGAVDIAMADAALYFREALLEGAARGVVVLREDGQEREYFGDGKMLYECSIASPQSAKVIRAINALTDDATPFSITVESSEGSIAIRGRSVDGRAARSGAIGSPSW